MRDCVPMFTAACCESRRFCNAFRGAGVAVPKGSFIRFVSASMHPSCHDSETRCSRATTPQAQVKDGSSGIDILMP